jgi:hypothetical protein
LTTDLNHAESFAPTQRRQYPEPPLRTAKFESDPPAMASKTARKACAANREVCVDAPATTWASLPLTSRCSPRKTPPSNTIDDSPRAQRMPSTSMSS